MFPFAILTAIYGNLIFLLGISGLIYPLNLGLLTIGYAISLIFFLQKQLSFRFYFTDKKSTLVLWLLICLALVNLLGALGPETAFDALWYHLTFPKLYLLQHSIHYFSGTTLAYSVMPKFGELLFTPALAFGSEIWAKLIQFFFGIISVVLIYKIARNYVSPFLSLVACLIFYSNIVVAWESTTAYIDLIRTFYEVAGYLTFILWMKKQNRKYLLLLGVYIGTAIATKILAFSSLFLFCVLITVVILHRKKSLKKIIIDVTLFGFVTIIVASPWLVISALTTGNPFYPIFSPILQPALKQNISSLQKISGDIIQLFLFSEDPLSPIYLIMLPLLFVYFKKLSWEMKIMIIYCLLSFFFWFVTPRSGGGRFILPYLPIWSILAAIILEKAQKTILYRLLLITIVGITFITIVYRGVANSRYLPVVFEQESKETYLANHLNFSFGDFYDTDGYFASHIKSSDNVLLIGFHNLYYVNFPFIDSSYVQKGDKFNYIATQHADLPKQFEEWQLVYENKKTGVKLYNRGRKLWQY